MLFKSPRGTKDILPPETNLWQEIEQKARGIFARYAYEEIRTPVFEEATLFSRSLGDLTDIVQKQMFLIKRDTDTFVLRPEATAAIIRSYIENSCYQSGQLTKWFYIGPMFRAERPQKGRLRQFHHIGCEAIGSDSPFLDAETIRLATDILSEIGVTGFEVVVNTLGCLNDKKRFGIHLKESLLPKRKAFCEDCQARLAKNVFRVLDCKNRQCQDIVAGFGLGSQHICQECLRHFEGVKQALGAFGVTFRLDPLLVRGLDYYTQTVFEITHSGLGAQDALGAGGRYDNLVEELGGPHRGAIGFALGLERLLLAQGVERMPVSMAGLPDCYVIALGDAALKRAVGILNLLRREKIATDMDYAQGSLKSALRRADARKARMCLILGDNELAKGVVILKDMAKGTQEEVSLDHVAAKVKEGLC